MECPDLAERLSPFLNGELDPLASREVERHLAACPGCAAALERRRLLGERLREAVPYQRAPEALRERVLAQARAAAEPRPAVREAPARPLRRQEPWRWAGMAAAAALIIGLTAGVWLLALRADDGALAREAVA